MPVSKPELGLIGRDDLQNGKKWEIRETRPVRGLPRTNIDGKQMDVPLGISELDRCIRAHEMTHAKVSPNTEDFRGWLSRERASEHALIIAEETRVNFLVKTAGIPIEKFLTDGRESLDAREYLKSNDWIAYFSSGLSGVFTAGEKLWAKEAKSNRPNWSKQMRHAQKFVRDYWAQELRNNYGDVSAIAVIENPERIMYADNHALNGRILAGEEPAIDRYGDPAYLSLNTGFYYTEKLAKIIDTMLGYGDLIDSVDSDLNLMDQVDIKMGDHQATYKFHTNWDTLRFWPVKPMRTVPGAVSRKRIPMSSGTNPRRINRMLTDPERRIFDRVKKATGGIFLIDGSGSMRFEAEHIEQMVLSAPGCTVAIYSAPDNDKEHGRAFPTMFILAENGKTLSRDEIFDVQRNLNNGNGCDLPALQWAIAKRKNNKTPIIWVTDGVVHQNPAEVIRTSRVARSNDVMFALTPEMALVVMRKLRKQKHVKTDLPWGFRQAMDSLLGRSGGEALDPRLSLR